MRFPATTRKKYAREQGPRLHLRSIQVCHSLIDASPSVRAAFRRAFNRLRYIF